MPIVLNPATAGTDTPPSIEKVAYDWSERTSIQFGGQPIPVGIKSGPTMPWIDLNDGVQFFGNGLQIPDAHSLQVRKLMYAYTAYVLASTTEPLLLIYTCEFDEVSQSLSSIRSQMLFGGQQWLTFDGGVTGILAYAQSFGDTKVLRNDVDVRGWACSINFLAVEAFYRDIAPTNLGPWSWTTGLNGASNVSTQNITYNGEVFANPYYYINMPLESGSPMVAFTLGNNTAGVAIQFALPCNGLTYVVDTQATAVYQSGNVTNQITQTGSFPYLYAPRGLENTVILAAATASGSFSGTWSISYQSRYSL